PTRWFGSGYLLALGVSVGLVALCVWAYCARRPGLMAVAIIASVVAGFAFIMLTLLAHAVFNSIACIASFSWPLSPATFARLLVGTLVVVYGAAIWNGAAQIRELIALKKKYPLVSIAPRLDFEERAGEPTAATKAALSSPLSPGVLASLDESERDLIFHRSRPTYLRLLHEATRRQFELAAGFGVARMP